MDKIKVLLVEDEQITALDLLEKLDMMGFTVTAVAESGGKAVALAGTTRPDLILMDIILDGDMDGIEASKKIRRDFDIPIIYISALSDEATMQRAKSTAPFAYLIKPFDTRELKFTIETAFYRHRFENRLSARLRYEEGLANASQWLLADIDPQEALAQTMRYLLAASGVSRLYIFENYQDAAAGLCVELVRENCAAGVSPRLDNPLSRRFPYSKIAAGILERLQKGEAFQAADATAIAAAGNPFAAGDVLSLLIIPIHAAGRFWGFIGFDDVVEPRRWDEEDIRLLRTAADMISAYMKRRQAEEKLKESEQKYRLLIEGLNEAVYRLSLPDGTYDYLSPAVENVFGYRSAEFMKTPMFLKTIVHPDSRGYFAAVWEDILAGRVPPACEYKIIDHEKKERWIFQSHKGLFDSQGNIVGIEGICRDITRRKILEERLQAIAAEWYATFDAINDPIALLNSERIILRCNQALTTLTGKSYSELVGRVICEAIHETPPDPALCPFFRMNASRKRESATISVAERWFYVSVDPIFDAAGDLAGAVHIMNDISAQKRAEDNLRTQQEHLLQADKMITLGILVSGMAHEINNPNNSIALNSQFLEKAWQSIIPILDEYYDQDKSLTVGGINYEKFKKKLPALFSGISDSSKRIRHIVDDLKSFSRKESIAVKTPIDINLVVKSAVNLMNNVIKKSTHHFKLSCAKNLPMIKGNFQGLEQVIVNLVQNACQALANPERGISICTYYDKKSNQAIVSVADEGVGIPDKNMKYIMEPFFTTRRTAGGTGLGLAVAARIAAEHGATLYFTSTPGKGTDARIRFQVEQEDAKTTKRRKND